MLRRVMVLGLVAVLIAGLAAFAALRTSTDEAEAQVTAYQMNQLCLEITTSLYKGSFTPNCPPNHQLLVLPDAYPISLCASAYDGFLRAPQPGGACPPATKLRIDLPAEMQVNVCYYYFTGRLGLPNPYPNGACSGASFLVTFPSGFAGNADTYQTLGNVDIDVPAPDGVLANDAGLGLEVTAFDALSIEGGEVAVNPDGSFTYTPPMPDPDAFTGADTFTYTVEDDNTNSEVVTVTIQVLNPVVWFVDADAGDLGDGRRLTPFNTVDAVNDDGADPDDPDDFIFFYEAATPYASLLGSFQLEEGQYLVGQEVELEEILQDAIEGSALMGLDATSLPPFMALPPANPSADFPLLTNDDSIPLAMDDDSTAAGLTITGEEAPGVQVFSADNATLDRVEIYGGVDEDGEPGVVVDGSSLAVIDAVVQGGDGNAGVLGQPGGSSLQGVELVGDGGDGIAMFAGSLTVTGSDVYGGDGGTAILSSERGSTLQGLLQFGGDGGNGISVEAFGQVTVTGASDIRGGHGSFGELDGGAGGDGIEAGALFLPEFNEASGMGRSLEGPPPPMDPPSITVSGASLITGGNGAEGGEGGGDGGHGIETSFFLVSISESSTVTGGNGAEGGTFGGFGGVAIFMALFVSVDDITGSTLQGMPTELTLINVDDGSTLAGGNGGSGEDFAGIGGDGILAIFESDFLNGNGSSSLQGLDSATVNIDVTASDVTGGVGGASGDFGDGGFGIVVLSDFFECCIRGPELQGNGSPSSIEIDVNVTSSTVSGGPGSSGDEAGFGGFGISHGFFPFFFDDIAERSIEPRGSELLGGGPFIAAGDLTVVDSTVSGGAGGAGEFGGIGGVGIFSAGDDIISGIEGTTLQGPPPVEGDTTVSNSSVSGGAGGSGADGGAGGDAIVALGMNLLVDQSTTASGGAGADATEEDGGGGGFGIYAEAGTIVVDNATITAGDGGDNVDVDGDDGFGGEGIYGFFVDLTVRNSSQITGGDSGFSETDEEDFGIPGGDGIFAEESVVTVESSTVIAGNGGFGGGIEGGPGGHGVHVAPCFFCNTLVVTNATITGGNGGASAGNDGGFGGEGVLVEDDNATLTGSMITGGNGGSGPTDGDGAPAVVVFFDDSGDYGIVLQTNTLTAGTGDAGLAQGLLAIQDGTGSVCIDATGNMSNGIFELENSSGTLGITQASLAAMGAANNGVTVTSADPITFNCTVVQN